ncbi:MAG: ATP-dependent zinc metalloprotease FtsH, partial [Kiritimatiellaeota bacterium]|nr:ATP-dependent zinc metalloprotease FtsH [Kiritimatiellota bacterium]
IAGEADRPFFSISGSDFVEMFVGVGASRVRDMFQQAHKSAPCLVFIDEIDAVGRSRFTGIGGGHDEREQTLNALLVEMDGFEANDGVIVIAATNRPDVLDPALTRPGRFDRQVVIDLPSLEGRVEILKVHAKKIKLADGTDLTVVARGTPGYSGADLANLINEAALIATKQNKEAVDIEDLEEARDKVMWGKERRSRKIDDDDKKITAYHEAGHAIISVLMPDAEPLHKITIIPRGMSLGSTMFLPKKDHTHLSKSKLLAQLAVSMGGRAAEEVFLPDICTGARQDLSQATQIAHSMVCSWGMSERLGPRTFGRNEELIFLGKEVNRTQDYSEMTAREIDAEVSALLKTAHEKAVALLTAHRAATEALVAELTDKETLPGYIAEELVKYGRVREPHERGEEPPPVPPALPEEN